MSPNFFSIVLLLAALVSAAMCGQLGKHKGDPVHTQTVGISQELFDMLQLMSQYSAAAYLPSNTNSTGDVLSCTRDHCKNGPIDLCPRVEAANASTSDEFMDTPDGDDHGYVSADHANEIVTLAFRGSQSMENWKNNLDVKKIHNYLCKKCKVHKGFWEQFIGQSDDYFDQLDTAHQLHPGYRVVVTGHSLGGALATLAAAYFRTKTQWYLEHLELYTFGSPRVGNEEFARFLTEQSKLSWRVTSTSDPVPRLPPVHLGYWHMQPEYWIAAKPDGPSPSNITVLTGYNNDKGNRNSHGVKFEPHRHYFGHIGGCKQ